MNVDRWFPISISQTQITGGFTIVLTTDIACHLFLYWTDKAPWVHRVSALHRGLTVPWDSYWCFVVWTLIDQDEPGDTLIHTYNWTGWQNCQTKYFRFHGTIGGNTSPSDSPIFHKHYLYEAPPGPVLRDFYNENDDDQAILRSDIGRGQTFTPSSSYNLSRFRLKLRRDGLNTSGTLDVSLRAAAGNLPSGPDLAICKLPWDEIPDGTWEWIEFILDSSHPVVQGTQMALVAFCPTSGGQGYTWREDVTSPTYEGGQESYHQRGRWTAIASRDFMFETYSES